MADAELIVLTGDVAAGPMPVQTLDLLVSLGERALRVNGNADRELVEVVAGKAGHHGRIRGERLLRRRGAGGVRQG